MYPLMPAILPETTLGLSTKTKNPPLSLILHYLNHTLEQFDETKEEYKNALDKHQRGSALTTEEIFEVLLQAKKLFD